MSLVQSLLSRLLHGWKKEGASGPPAEETPPPVSAPAPSPKPQEPQLEFPLDHPINELWRIYCTDHPQAPPPRLCLEGVSEADAKAQLLQLQLLANTSAKQRLALVQPKPEKGRKEKEKEPPAPHLNALAVVFIPRNGLSAWLLVYPPAGGGKDVERGDLIRTLERERVTFGVDKAVLDALPQSEERYFHLFPVARGEAAENGVDGVVRELFPRTVERTCAVDEQNRMDYTALTFFSHVEEGGVICEIEPPTQGTPGHTVQNQTIPAKDGRAAPVPKGKNTQLSEDGRALVASISGLVEFSGYGFQVTPLLEIGGNVDFSTGNINFLGDVHIHGDVCSGFSVRAMGNVTVDGVVESCTVESGGDLVVVRGVQGDEQAVLRSQGNVFAKYLENCSIYVREALHTDCLINCDVYCGSSVEVRSGRMTIMGGSIRAAREVSAGIIGSRTECRTDVILGGHPCEDLDHGLLSRELQALMSEQDRIEQQPDSPHKNSSLGKLRVRQLVAQKKLAELAAAREASLEKSPSAEQAAPGPRRMLCDTVYPGVWLTIDGIMTQITEKLTPCAASLLDGEIHLI